MIIIISENKKQIYSSISNGPKTQQQGIKKGHLYQPVDFSMRLPKMISRLIEALFGHWMRYPDLKFFHLSSKLLRTKNQYCKNIAKRSINIFLPLFVEVKYGQYKIAHKVFRHNEKKRRNIKRMQSLKREGDKKRTIVHCVFLHKMSWEILVFYDYHKHNCSCAKKSKTKLFFPLSLKLSFLSEFDFKLK